MVTRMAVAHFKWNDPIVKLVIYHNRWKPNSRLTELASPLSVPSLLLLLVGIANHNFAPRIDCMHFQLTSILVICELIAAAGRE